MLTRRRLLQAMGLTAAAGSLPGLALAKADTDKRLVLVVLRGAVDGLALAAPYGDGRDRTVRGELALDDPGSRDGVHRQDQHARARKRHHDGELARRPDPQPLRA